MLPGILLRLRFEYLNTEATFANFFSTQIIQYDHVLKISATFNKTTSGKRVLKINFDQRITSCREMTISQTKHVYIFLDYMFTVQKFKFSLTRLSSA